LLLRLSVTGVLPHRRGRVTDSTSDEILMAAYQAGNQDAFGELFDRHAGRVYGFLVRRLGDATAAEDLHQEAFLRVHRARESYDPERPFRAWLFAILHNLVNDTLRSRRRAPVTEPLGGDQSARTDSHLDLEGPINDQSPERIFAARESTQALSRALSALSSDEATVLILARFEGLSYDDIGSVVGRSATAAKQLAYRALKRVRSELIATGHGEVSR
jgi:RNA polymerase sigma-70 factor (ECF subfamily)